VSTWQSAAACYSATGGSGKFNNKNFFAKSPPPAAVVNAIPFAGFSAFVNLKTGTLMGKDAQGSYLTAQQMINWATQANQ
jgi:hypothetical protein